MLYCGRNQTFWAPILAVCAEGPLNLIFFDPQSNMKSRFCSSNLLWGILVLYVLCAAVPSGVSAADASAGDPETYGPQNVEFLSPSPEEKMPRTTMDGISDSIILGEEAGSGTQSAPETASDRGTSSIPKVLETVSPQMVPSSETASENAASSTLPDMKSTAVSGTDSETESKPASAPSCFSAVLDRGNRKNAFHFASEETVTPVDTPSQTASAEAAAPTETAAPSPKKPISLSVSLLERLCPEDQQILENVQAVDLQTFLGSPNLQYSEDGLASALRLYWRSSALKSETVFRLRQAEELSKLAGSADKASQAVYRSAADAAKTKADAAKLALRANALELGRAAGYAESMTAQTLPHAGSYETRFQQFVPAYGSRAAYLHGLIDFRRQQLISAASACVSAENLLKMQTAEKADAEKILQSWETLEHRRKLFFDVLTEFNAEILQYVLLISRRRGPDLVPLLVRPQNASSAEKTFADENRLDAPAVPYAAAPGTSEVPILSEEVKNRPPILASTPIPAESESDAGIPKNTAPNGPGIPTFAEDANAETPVYEENAAIDVVLPEAAPTSQPYGIPAEETAPPGSDFQPIGGPNGVISDPTLGSPAMQDGAARAPQDPLRRLSFRSASPSETFVQFTAKPSVLVESADAVSETGSTGTSGSFAAFQAGLSLRNVLERTDHSRREEAIRNYWHYVFLQKQICVLKYQETLLSAMTDRVFADSENAGAGKFGVALEFHSLVLRTELLGTEAEAWKVLYRVSQLMQIPLTWPTEFPEALTELKAENFQLSTSRLSPGSAEEARFLPIIRQLYTSAGHLPEAFRKVQAQESLIAPPLRDGTEENSVTSRLKTADYVELETLLGSMVSARKDSFEYLKFLFQTNALYSTCILAADPFGPAPEKLEQTLTN